MSWFSKVFGRRAAAGPAPLSPSAEQAVVAHLEEFLASRRGVEMFVEQPTTMARASLVLVAHDGEWTRRSVPSDQWARQFAARHSLPAYEAAVVGYPQRMRDFNARQRAQQRRTSS